MDQRVHDWNCSSEALDRDPPPPVFPRTTYLYISMRHLSQSRVARQVELVKYMGAAHMSHEHMSHHTHLTCLLYIHTVETHSGDWSCLVRCRDVSSCGPSTESESRECALSLTDLALTVHCVRSESVSLESRLVAILNISTLRELRHHSSALPSWPILHTRMHGRLRIG